METSRKHGSYDMRWPCVSNNGSRAVHIPTPEVRFGPPHLRLVGPEVMSAADAEEREAVGTRRLVAALTATSEET